MARASGKSIAQMKRANELALMGPNALDDGMRRIWAVMRACIDRGLDSDGTLPGGLKVKRRAKAIRAALERERGLNLTAPHVINDWISTYAMAVNEENAAGGQVVTAPTNGAAGVVPATIRYWLDHVPGASEARVDEFLLTAPPSAGWSSTTPRFPVRNAAARQRSARPLPWPPPGWPPCWAARPNRSKTPPKSRWNTIWA